MPGIGGTSAAAVISCEAVPAGRACIYVDPAKAFPDVCCCDPFLHASVIKVAENLTGATYGQTYEKDVSLRIISRVSRSYWSSRTGISSSLMA